jgi:hypothetical protein
LARELLRNSSFLLPELPRLALFGASSLPKSSKVAKIVFVSFLQRNFKLDGGQIVHNARREQPALAYPPQRREGWERKEISPSPG